MNVAEATVWWARLDDAGTEELEAVLSADELARAAGFRFERDRQRFVVSRALLRSLLGDYLGLRPTRIELAYGPNGKPHLTGEQATLRFNVSHSDGVVALAFCEGHEIGVDIEALRDGLSVEGIARRYLPPPAAAEIARCDGRERIRRFFRVWVRQEAYAKARGQGLELIGENPASEGWSVEDLSLLDGYAAAVAIEGSAPAQVTTMRI